MPNLAIFKAIYRFRKLVALYVAGEALFKLAKFAQRRKTHHAH